MTNPAWKTAVGRKYYVSLPSSTWSSFTYNRTAVKYFSSIAGKPAGKPMKPFTYHIEKWYPLAGYRFFTYRSRENGKIVLNERRGYDVSIPQDVNPVVTHIKTGPTFVDYTELRDKCMEKAYNKLRKSQLNLAVDVAESAATLKMLKGTLAFKSLLSEFFNDLIKGKKGKLGRMGMRKRMDYTSNKWLEYRYGWYPLVSSVYDGLDMLGKATFGNDNVFLKVRSGRSGDWQSITGNGTYDNPSVVKTTTCSRRGQLVATFKPQDGLKIEDWTTLNPATIAYELVPFSFVVDWFVDVGGFLEKFDNYRRFRKEFLNGCYTDTWQAITTETSQGTTFAKSLGANQAGPEGPQLYGQNQLLITRWNQRTVLSEWPMYSIVPRVKFTLNSQQQADAVALIWQLFASKTRVIRSL